ncbi:biopolymer transporter ExbD [Rhodobacterales bacterium HKCCE2091]|nr:biopolymer transporter ExbD [Rhodobacterales bacterium HKCCE2091]
MAMINVVFLLLVFFLMSAQIVPPEPFAVAPPEAAATAAELPADTLFVAADGQLAYEDARNDSVFAAIAARTADAPLAIRADADLPGADLAALLPRLAAAGVTGFDLVTVRP